MIGIAYFAKPYTLHDKGAIELDPVKKFVATMGVDVSVNGDDVGRVLGDEINGVAIGRPSVRELTVEADNGATEPRFEDIILVAQLFGVVDRVPGLPEEEETIGQCGAGGGDPQVGVLEAD